MSRPAQNQSEFLFGVGSAPLLSTPETLADLVAEISQIWGLPLYQPALVILQDHALDEVRGRLELVRSPDLPLTPSHPLALRVAGVEFSNRQIASWSLLEKA